MTNFCYSSEREGSGICRLENGHTGQHTDGWDKWPKPEPIDWNQVKDDKIRAGCN